MNCTDITTMLDEGRAARPRSAAAIELHLAACEACAAQYRADAGIAALHAARDAGMPPMPAALYERARQLQEAREPQAVRRPTRRPFLIGGLLLFGAAATLFSVVPGDDDAATA